MEQPKFDVDSGAELAYSKDARFFSAYQELQSEALALHSLTVSSGWQILSTFVKDMISAHTDRLIATTDIDEMRRLQEHIKAYTNVLTFPQSKIHQAEDLKAQYEGDSAPSDPADETAG